MKQIAIPLAFVSTFSLFIWNNATIIGILSAFQVFCRKFCRNTKKEQKLVLYRNIEIKVSRVDRNPVTFESWSVYTLNKSNQNSRILVEISFFLITIFWPIFVLFRPIKSYKYCKELAVYRYSKNSISQKMEPPGVYKQFILPCHKGNFEPNLASRTKICVSSFSVSVDIETFCLNQDTFQQNQNINRTN